MNEESHISLNDICRTCLTNIQQLATYDLFANPGLAEKLCDCTSLPPVNQQDCLPKCLCSNCYNKLNDFHEFQKQCINSQQQLKDMLANDCFLVNNFDDVGPKDAEDGIPIEEDERINYDPLLNSKLGIIENEEDVFQMIENVDNESDDLDELSSQCDEFEANSSDSDDAKPLARLRTRATKIKKVSNAEEVDSPRLDSSDGRVQKTKAKSQFKRIPSNEHEFQKPIDCHICHQKFNKAMQYEEHMKLHNEELPIQCQVETCKKRFMTAAGLRHHVDHAHVELCKLYSCTIEGCDKSFPRTRMLTYHMKTVHKILKSEVQDHPCSECEKVFRCPTALKKHMYKHTGEELPISCNICNKRFHINSELRDHLLRHAGVKNHVCPYCGVGKTTRQEWNKHILTHTKEKQFQCRQCDHASHNKQALANHVKVVHMKIKDFACQYCGKTFGKSHACKIHERIHTGENCSTCKICGKVFLFEKRLIKHLQMHEERDVPVTSTAVKPLADFIQASPNVSLDMMPPMDMKSLSVVPQKQKGSHRVERVDISQLAGTAINPIPSVSVPSWTPQINFTKKEGQHICPGCGRGFNHIGNMKLHYKVIHEKIKDFTCRFCPKRFGKAQYLRHHEYTHTGERPYGCKLCDKHFSHGSSLRKHMISHNRPPKVPKTDKGTSKTRNRKRSKIELNKSPIKNYAQYEDPTAERAAAAAELLAQQQEENETKRNKEIKTREVQKAATEQLQKMQDDQVINKISSNSFHKQVYDE